MTNEIARVNRPPDFDHFRLTPFSSQDSVRSMIRRLSIFVWIFVGLFLLSAGMNAFLSYQNFILAQASATAERKIGEGRTLQTSTQNLVNELVGLGQKYPTILPVLQRYGVPILTSPSPSYPALPKPSSPSQKK